MSLERRSICHLYLFLEDIPPLLYKRWQRQEQPQEDSPWRNLNPPPFYLCSRVSEFRRTVFKFDTTLRSHLVRPKDTIYPAKQDGVVYGTPYKVYIGKTGRCMPESIKEHDRGIRLARIQTGHYPILERGQVY